MNIQKLLICAAVWLTGLACLAQAASPAAVPPTTLAAAVEAAYARAVQRQEAQGQLRRAAAEQALAQSIWPAPPAVELAHNSGRQGLQETEIGVALPLWMPGQKAAARAFAQSEIDYAQAFERAGKLRVAGEVREAAWAVAAAEAELTTVDKQIETLKRLTDDVERRVKAGDLARADALAARGEWLAAQASRADVQQRLDSARRRWITLTGLPPLAEGQASEALPAPESDRHPEVELARLTVERARARLETVRLQRRQPPEVSVRYRQEAGGLGAESNRSVGLGIRVPFGSAALNGPQEAAAQTELDVAQATEARAAALTTAEQETARAGVSTAEEQLRLEQERAALLRERAALYQKSFHAGDTGLPDLLRVLEAAAQAENQLTRQRIALGLARSRLLQIQGILP